MIVLVRLLAAALLFGTTLLAVGALMHPALTGDAAAQLRVIAATPHWRAIHLAMLAGSGVVIAGIWVRLLIDGSGARAALLAALATVTVGEAMNALNIAYMAGAGSHLAERFQAGDEAVASLYAATHPTSLMTARFGNYLVALGAAVLGYAEWHDASSPKFFAWLAWLAAAAGVAGILFFEEASRFTLAAVAMLSAWQLGIAVWALIPTGNGTKRGR